LGALRAQQKGGTPRWGLMTGSRHTACGVHVRVAGGIISILPGFTIGPSMIPEELSFEYHKKCGLSRGWLDSRNHHSTDDSTEKLNTQYPCNKGWTGIALLTISNISAELVFLGQKIYIQYVGMKKAGHEGPAFACWRGITDNLLGS
jgi:hypothetical protein